MTEHRDEWHVTPTADKIEHDLNADCACGPTTEPVKREDGSVGWVVTHHSLDGRERDEQPRTTADLTSDVPDLHVYRAPLPDECEHGATVTAPMRVEWANGVAYETTEPLTYCYECSSLVDPGTTGIHETIRRDQED